MFDNVGFRTHLENSILMQQKQGAVCHIRLTLPSSQLFHGYGKQIWGTITVIRHLGQHDERAARPNAYYPQVLNKESKHADVC